jgi:hypothetical protein
MLDGGEVPQQALRWHAARYSQPVVTTIPGFEAVRYHRLRTSKVASTPSRSWFEQCLPEKGRALHG